MDIKIDINFENGKVKLVPMLPIELADLNEDLYMKISDEPIYTCNNLELNFNQIYSKLGELISILINKFKINNPTNTYNFKFFISSYDTFNNNNYINDIITFIKIYNTLDLTLSTENYIDLIKNIKADEAPNLKLVIKNSDEEVKYDEFYNMYSTLYEIVDFVNHYNLSPLEKVMLIYDIVKSKVYKKEGKDEDYGTSRNLNRIFNSDKIVCVGFSNLINFLLTNVGIKTDFMLLNYEGKKVGHQRDYVYIDDKKYNIKGVFALDATVDSKKDEKYLDNYRFFLKPFSILKKIPGESITSPNKLKLLEKTSDEIEKIIDESSNHELMKFLLELNSLLSVYNSEINFSELIKYTKNDKDKILKIFEDTKKMYNRQVNKIDFMRALYKVRKIEYINNIAKKEPNEDYIKEVCNRYYTDNSVTKLMKAIGIYEEPNLDNEIKDAKASSVDQDVLRMRFLRALKTKVGDMPESEIIKKM